MIHENTMLYWLYGFLVSVVLIIIDMIYNKCKGDGERYKEGDAFAIVLASAFLIPIAFVLAYLLGGIFCLLKNFKKHTEKDFMPGTSSDFEWDGEGLAMTLLALWVGIMAISIMWFDSHYGKDLNLDGKKPKTEVVTEPSGNFKGNLTLDIEPVPNFCPIFAVEN